MIVSLFAYLEGTWKHFNFNEGIDEERSFDLKTKPKPQVILMTLSSANLHKIGT